MRITARILPFLSPQLCLAAKSCYFPNKRLAANDFPCDPNAEESACCGQEALCLTNKLCRTPGGNLIRGTCADQNWDSPQCAQYCLSVKDGGEDLISCYNATGTDTEYCCKGGPAGCCDSGVARFEVLPANPQVRAKWDASASSVVVLVTLTSTASSSSSSQSTSTWSTSSTATSSVTIAPTNITSSSTTAAATTAKAASETGAPSSPAEGLTFGAKAGIGVGVAVVIILLGALAILLRKLRQNRRELQAERERADAIMAERQRPAPPPPPMGELGSKYILDGTPRSEMDSGGSIAGGVGYDYHGYGDGPVRVELPASPRRPEMR